MQPAPALTATLPDFVHPVGDGVYAIDTAFHRDRFDAAWLVVEDGRAAFIDTGTALAVPRLLAALAALGLAVDAVDHVIPTHVHLDHAGGVGTLLQSLPRAQVRAHPRAVRHLVDPAALWQGALAVYGEAQMQADYGVLVGVPAGRISATRDGEEIRLAGRVLAVAHTPGHARHHHCLWDARSRGWFTGDTFGIAYPELTVDGRPFLFPTSTPVQFEPGPLQASIARMLAAAPTQMYLTHFGRIGDVPAAGARLLALLARMVERALALAPVPAGAAREAALAAAVGALLREAARAHGTHLADAEIDRLLADDVRLNAQGLEVWLARDTAKAA